MLTGYVRAAMRRPVRDPAGRRDLLRGDTGIPGLGFEGPFVGGKHHYMAKADLRLVLPNPHQSDIGTELLTRLLRQAGIGREDWEKL